MAKIQKKKNIQICSLTGSFFFLRVRYFFLLLLVWVVVEERSGGAVDLFSLVRNLITTSKKLFIIIAVCVVFHNK